MKAKPCPTREQILAVYEYKHGDLYHRRNQGPARAGSLAGYVCKNGYRVVVFKCKQYKLHRLIWILHYGYIDPNTEIDHIDKNRLNNDISNLRLATSGQNGQNRSLQYNNKTGCNGVRWCKVRKNFSVTITHNRKKIYLGRYRNLKDAIAARQKAELRMNWNQF